MTAKAALPPGPGGAERLERAVEKAASLAIHLVETGRTVGLVSVSGAVSVDPIREWLLTVDVADVAPGDAVTVTFRPPGFPVMLLAFGLCAVMLVGWPILRLVQGRRK